MGYQFGSEEKLTCIVDVPVKGPRGEKLCLAFKSTTYSVLAPAYFHDDGYVLKVVAANSYFPVPSGPELLELQASGDLPKPFPAYQIPLTDYAYGNLLWLALAFGVASLFVSSAVKRRRHASLIGSSPQPPSIGAPELRTKTDRWLDEEGRKLLEPGETIQQQAYGYNADLSGTAAIALKARYVILTDRRLLVIQSRVGAFGPLHENNGVQAVPRADITRVEHEERSVRFHLANGEQIPFFAEWSERKLSNQHRFLRDVPRLLGSQAERLVS